MCEFHTTVSFKNFQDPHTVASTSSARLCLPPRCKNENDAMSQEPLTLRHGATDDSQNMTHPLQASAHHEEATLIATRKEDNHAVFLQCFWHDSHGCGFWVLPFFKFCMKQSTTGRHLIDFKSTREEESHTVFMQCFWCDSHGCGFGCFHSSSFV